MTRVLADGRVFALGGTTPLDGRLSWAPQRPGRFQVTNCYLLEEGPRHLLIDTGVRADGDVVGTQLEQVVTPGERLMAFITRPELDCVGNLGLIRSRYRLEGILAGGRPNPFDAFDFAGSEGARPAGVLAAKDRPYASALATFEVPAINRVDTIDLGPEREVRVVVPLLRFLPTYWLYDEATGTLFTSDLFSHVDQGTDDPADAMLREAEADPTSEQSLRESLLCKFWWLPGAATGDLVANLRSIFSELDPEIVAPSHGTVLIGRGLIRRHLDLLVSVLEGCDRDLGGLQA